MPCVLAMAKASQNGKIFFKDGMSFLGFGPRTLSVAIEIQNGLNNKISEKAKRDRKVNF